MGLVHSLSSPTLKALHRVILNDPHFFAFCHLRRSRIGIVVKFFAYHLMRVY